jgi:hypothetical protein
MLEQWMLASTSENPGAAEWADGLMAQIEAAIEARKADGPTP